MVYIVIRVGKRKKKKKGHGEDKREGERRVNSHNKWGEGRNQRAGSLATYVSTVPGNLACASFFFFFFFCRAMFTDPLHVAGKACSMSFWNGRKKKFSLKMVHRRWMVTMRYVSNAVPLVVLIIIIIFCWIVVGMSNGKPPSDVPRRAN